MACASTKHTPKPPNSHRTTYRLHHRASSQQSRGRPWGRSQPRVARVTPCPCSLLLLCCAHLLRVGPSTSFVLRSLYALNRFVCLQRDMRNLAPIVGELCHEFCGELLGELLRQMQLTTVQGEQLENGACARPGMASLAGCCHSRLHGGLRATHPSIHRFASSHSTLSLSCVSSSPCLSLLCSPAVCGPPPCR